MSKLIIEKYHRKLAQLKRAGKTKNESSIRKAFLQLVESYAEEYDLVLVDELPLESVGRAIPDATLKSKIGIDNGYIENKDIYDDLELEIENKIAKGYPLTNIIYEDSEELVFYQDGSRIAKIKISDNEELHKILTRFVSYKRPEIARFEKAIEAFQEDIPQVLQYLRESIDKEYKENAEFNKKSQVFLENCHRVINPHLTFTDVREMLIQHILTEDIFIHIFSDAEFHRENNIAKELNELISTFFKKDLKRNTLGKIAHYYDTIKQTASSIYDHSRKQEFLKVIYENFYKAYNPDKADTQGIIYTPIEVVRFMITACDDLLYEHFDKTLASKNVDILDPCTGTGIFITEILKHFEGNPDNLTYKYDNEIHCNELEILPYYIANLNIEHIYKQVRGVYKEYSNICLVDTLDNMAFDKSKDLFAFAGLSEENLERVKRQNEKKISVIIGNPPYNANQQNENDNNKNRVYPEIDKRIKDTYIKESKAQKTKQYDMYKRFIRWASDRIDEEGIVAFVTNNSFLEAKQDDGFRKIATEEFNEIYSINLRGAARGSGEIRKKEADNIFENKIRVGVSINFFIKRKTTSKCKIFVYDVDDYLKYKEKREFIQSHTIQKIKFDQRILDKNLNWKSINQETNDFDELLPLIDKQVKAKTLGGKVGGEANAIFKMFSNGVNTARDDWVYDFDKKNLEKKVKKFIQIYNDEVKNHKGKKKGRELDNAVDCSIKWSRDLKNKLLQGQKIKFDKEKTHQGLYRPYIQKNLYFDYGMVDVAGLFNQIFPYPETINKCIIFSNNSPKFSSLPTNKIASFDTVSHSVVTPLHYYNKSGHQQDNISDWALNQFQTHYANKTITKEDIFHYVYAVLNNPAYKEKYKDNLKTEYPRIPLYKDFHKWVGWGKDLMDIHINFEKVEPYKDIEISNLKSDDKPLLKLNKSDGIITLDKSHIIKNIPQKAFEYKIGSRSPIEWVLEGYKPKKYNPEKNQHHKLLAEEFNKYDWKEIRKTLTDLIPRLITLSTKTVDIYEEMEKYSK